MADVRGDVTDALMNQAPVGGYPGQAVATRGGTQQAPSPYGGGFTSFGLPPRPQAPAGGGGFVPPSGASGAGLFAPPPPTMAPGAVAPTGGFAAPPNSLFAPPPAPGAAPPAGGVVRPPRPAFTQTFSPGALANPGTGQVSRGGGRGF